jgi:hypothetical protein
LNRLFKIASLRWNKNEMPRHRSRYLVLVLAVAAAILRNTIGGSTTASVNPPAVKMVNSNPVLEMVVDGVPTRLILTTGSTAEIKSHCCDALELNHFMPFMQILTALSFVRTRALRAETGS